MELNIKSELRPNLPKIEIPFPSGDDASGYACYAGYRYPIVMISKSIIAYKDILSFELDTGLTSPIPTLSMSFQDYDAKFRDDDYIDHDTEIVIWLGQAFAEPWPTKIQMIATHVQIDSSVIVLEAKLKFPTERITILNDTLENMLRDFADKTGFGIKFNHEEYDELDYRDNYTNMLPEDFIVALFDDLKLPWFIDNEYNIVSVDLKLQIAKHVTEKLDQYVDIMLNNAVALDKPEKVQYTNKVDAGQFRFWDKNPAFIQGTQGTVPLIQNVEFSKNAEIDLAAQQVSENQPLQQAPLYDTWKLSFKTTVNAYLQLGTTIPVIVYTDANTHRKIQPEQSVDKSGDISTNQKIMVDYTGIYLIQSLSYEYMPFQNTIEVYASLQFDEPRDIPEETPSKPASW